VLWMVRAYDALDGELHVHGMLAAFLATAKPILQGVT